MTKEELAYIAGLFDGEGSCGIESYRASKNGLRYLRVRARISNTYRPVLEWVAEKAGCGIVCSNGHHYSNRKPGFNWHVVNSTAAGFLKEIRPFLIIKADKVDQILSSRISGREQESRAA